MTLLFKEVNDHDLRALARMIGGLSMENGPWIAGGCARRLWYDLPWKTADVDVFFPDPNSFDRACTMLDALQTKIDVVLADGYSIKPMKSQSVHVTENAKSYQVQIGRVHPNVVTVQAIRKRWCGSMEDVLDDFDLTVCRFISDGTIVAADATAIADCDAKILRRSPGTSNKISANRVAKYCIYGFEPTRDVMLDILESHRNGTLIEESNNDDY
jgi:hypothetical protein